MGRTSDADQRLKQAALDLMWEESYGSVTIDDICQRADVKKGSFYYFFDSKSDLAVAALERLWTEQMRPQLDAQFSPSVDPLQRLVNYLEAMFVKQAEAKAKSGRVLGCPICCVGSEMSTQDEKLSAKIREICTRKRRYFESAIRDAVAAGVVEPCDPVEKVDGLIGLVEGVMGHGRIMNDPEVMRRLPAMALDFLRVRAAAGTRV